MSDARITLHRALADHYARHPHLCDVHVAPANVLGPAKLQIHGYGTDGAALLAWIDSLTPATIRVGIVAGGHVFVYARGCLIDGDVAVPVETWDAVSALDDYGFTPNQTVTPAELRAALRHQLGAIAVPA